jgi:hypothetical protein
MKSLLIATAMLGFAGTALASEPNTLVGPMGKVLVNSGKGYVAASDGMTVKAGDQVFVGRDSSVTAQIGSCAVSINAEAVFTVPTKAPCAKGQTALVEEGVMVTPASGAFGSIPWVPVLVILPVAALVTYAIVTAEEKSVSSP